jgi:phosphoglycerate dehydrogenase-like enzyme
MRQPVERYLSQCSRDLLYGIKQRGKLGWYRKEQDMDNEKADIGLVGLGVMGRNLALNIADHGFSVAGGAREEAQ